MGSIAAAPAAGQLAVDCNQNPVAGYNIFRSSRPDRDYIQLNTAPLEDTAYVDTSIGSQRALAVTEGTTYYYSVAAVDTDGDLSPRSAELSPSLEPAPEPDPEETAKTSTGGSGTPGVSGIDGGNSADGWEAVCFVTEAGMALNAAEWPFPTVVGVLALFGLLWLGNKKVKGQRSKAKGARKIAHRAKSRKHDEAGKAHGA
jgi:hypothetical protein